MRNGALLLLRADVVRAEVASGVRKQVVSGARDFVNKVCAVERLQSATCTNT